MNAVPVPEELFAQFCGHVYECDPKTCGENVCCKKFDIALTDTEQARFAEIFADLREFCPWLIGEAETWLTRTRHFTFIKKHRDFCALNYVRDGGYFCAWHSWAMAKQKNPLVEKPRGCAVWPLLEDGRGNFSLDESAPCLRKSNENSPDKNLLALFSSAKREMKITN